MEFLTGVNKQQQIEWRRSEVLSLASAGYSQRQIANKLQINIRAVNRDIQFLKRQAKENLEKHIYETIPYEYQKGMDSLNQLLRMGWDIANTTTDEKIKLQAGALIDNCTMHKSDLSTNGIIITESIKYIDSKMDHLNSQEKKLLQDIKIKHDNEIDEAAEGKGEGENKEEEDGPTTNETF